MTCKACEKMRELLYEVMMWHREAESSQYHQCERSICNWCVAAQKAIDMRCECGGIPAPLAAQARDKERLDWLAEYLKTETLNCTFEVNDRSFSIRDLGIREAIDAAREGRE